jgi:hypothetical protein
MKSVPKRLAHCEPRGSFPPSLSILGKATDLQDLFGFLVETVGIEPTSAIA